MTAVESIGTSSKIKGQYEKHKKFVRGVSFIFPSSFAKTKRRWCRKMRKGTVEVESVNNKKFRR